MSCLVSKKYFKYHEKPFYYGDYLKIFNVDRNKETVLDVGCGLGWFSDYFDNYTGIDSSKPVVLDAREKKRNVILSDVEEKFIFANESFSLVIAMDILEHLDDPLNVVLKSYRVLKEGGKIFIFVPDNQKWVWDDYSHKRPFSKKSLVRLVEDSGFRVKRVGYEPVMSGVNKFCKFFRINRRPFIFWFLARIPFFKRNIYVEAVK